MPGTADLPIRGRAEHLRRVDELVAMLRQGHGSMLLIEGPPGIGKSRLMDEVAARARRAGGRVLSGRALEDHQAVPFAPLFEAVLGVDPPVCDAATLRELGDRADSRFWVVQDLQAAIATAAASTPLAITIDDIHWADAGTMVALRALVAGLAQVPVLWILAIRSVGGRPEVRETVGELVTTVGLSAIHLHLNAIDTDAVAEVAGDVLRANVDESVLQLAEMARGNPFLVLELLNGLQEEDRIHVGHGRARAIGHTLPQRLASTMQRRLDRLSAGARHTVQVAAMLPESFSATLLARALGQSPAQMVAGIDEAIRADLLTDDRDDLTFRHDLLRRATQQTIPYALRRALERESAAILLELGAAPAEVAIRLARSADVGDLPAVTALREAARSLARSDPSGGADLSRRALDLLRPDDGARATVVTETVVLLNQALRYDEAQRLAVASLSSDMPADEEATIRLTQSIVSRDSPGWRADENRRGLQIAGVSDELRWCHQAWLAHNLAGDGQTQEARDVALAALEAMPDSDDPHARTMAECALARVNCVDGQGRDCLARIIELQPDPSSPHFPLLGAIVAFDLASLLATMGYLADATDVLTKAFEDSRQIPVAEVVLMLVRAQIEFAAGFMSKARESIESALPEHERLLINLYGGIGLVVMAAVAAHTDDRLLLRQVGIAARNALDGGPAARREAMCALAHAAWQRGDEVEAARWLGEEFDLLTSPLWTVGLDHVILAARVASTSSDAGLRQRVVSAVEVLERDEASVFSAVALHARGLLENDRDALDESVRRLATSGRPLLHAGAMEDSGHALARTGDRALAAERLSGVFDVYVAHEYKADAHRVARALQSLGVRRRVVRQREQTGWDSLTASEMRVLELVVDGASNQDVARRLSVSPHTVNSHVRRIFAKLGVHSRDELRRLARG